MRKLLLIDDDRMMASLLKSLLAQHGYDFAAIDLHVSRLRSKLETDLKQPRHLVTVRGLGYRFEW